MKTNTQVFSTQNAPHYTWGKNSEAWYLHDAADLSILEERMPPGETETLHYHVKAQQVFYILSGTALLEVDGEQNNLEAGESLHIKPKSLHRISNQGSGDLRFVLVSQPKAHGDRIDIIEYTDDLKEHIKTLNYEWLQKYFRVEPGDVISLSNPRTEIMDKGGIIFYARMNNTIAGTASLLKIDDETSELAKMAVTEEARGNHIGNALIEHCITIAKQQNVRRLLLYSNTSLAPAIHLYKKYGFTEVTLDPGHYERANIKMALVL
jgi:mannose-6-phosphate isomerase-like protein (cupin superfamily)/ribosomal protein S18 acetylase RimI-like enzyme